MGRVNKQNWYIREAGVQGSTALQHCIELTYAAYQKLCETITSGSIWYRGMQNRKKNGELFWEYASTSHALNIQGGITGSIAIKKGITDA